MEGMGAEPAYQRKALESLGHCGVAVITVQVWDEHNGNEEHYLVDVTKLILQWKWFE